MQSMAKPTTLYQYEIIQNAIILDITIFPYVSDMILHVWSEMIVIFQYFKQLRFFILLIEAL